MDLTNKILFKNIEESIKIFSYKYDKEIEFLIKPGKVKIAVENEFYLDINGFSPKKIYVLNIETLARVNSKNFSYSYHYPKTEFLFKENNSFKVCCEKITCNKEIREIDYQQLAYNNEIIGYIFFIRYKNP